MKRGDWAKRTNGTRGWPAARAPAPVAPAQHTGSPGPLCCTFRCRSAGRACDERCKTSAMMLGGGMDGKDYGALHAAAAGAASYAIDAAAGAYRLVHKLHDCNAR
ncbi:hypothetical protein EVAR_14976_1 [Eumeta japonica]|uniref:Uncharacterized protein n=1 Tax=Eumeta variegata TaxID=151549 RepID=A0A4C1X5E8_EUMVA|nr:hypothetical protein EVAR_14976_1 [Eumeta japonica]